MGEKYCQLLEIVGFIFTANDVKKSTETEFFPDR